MKKTFEVCTPSIGYGHSVQVDVDGTSAEIDAIRDILQMGASIDLAKSEDIGPIAAMRKQGILVFNDPLGNIFVREISK